jgi:DNA topoisomerase-1
MILIIVESPTKALKIANFLTNEYVVKASKGHIRDLDPKNMSIDFDNNFEPIYIITNPSSVSELKKYASKTNTIYIASDPDREGEQIAQSIYEILKPKNYKRLRFFSIEKKAILEAIKNGSTIDENLVNAQKARRILDRLFGYLISPIIQRKIGGKSAGRVQSVAVEAIIERENDIKKFIDKNSESTFFRVKSVISKFKSSLCETDKYTKSQYKGKMAQIALTDTDTPDEKAVKFLKKCSKSEFVVHDVSNKIALRNPSAPFTTATIQQEAFRKFSMPIDMTMRIAQKLYEAGLITYMRTDSVALSEEGQKEIKKVIESKYGKEYYQQNVYKSKTANSQEAHEAIRPTHPETSDISNDVDDEAMCKLYKLIWQRTIASQMKPAQINVTTIQIDIEAYKESSPLYYFQCQIEKVVFSGFMDVYVESTDDTEEDDVTKDFKGKIPKIGDVLKMNEVVCKQEYLRPPTRFTEASLVKYFDEKLNICRPATFVNIIKTILDREYVKIADVNGIKKDVLTLTITHDNSNIKKDNSTILFGKETKKMVPTELGIIVNDFLLKYFTELMDYKFTTKMEADLDAISNGDKKWVKVVRDFYEKVKPIVDTVSKMNTMSKETEKLLGKDKKGNLIYVTKTKYGPVVKKMENNKPVYSKIPSELTIETITLNEAIKLFEYPKVLGEYKGKNVSLKMGKNGLYIEWNNDLFSTNDMSEINMDNIIKSIEKQKAKIIAEFNIKHGKGMAKVVVLNGQYGPYINVKQNNAKKNYPIPKDIDPLKITEEQINTIMTKKYVKKFTKK